ncbi:putative ABC transport system permease protein [Deinobacterium chartae]|uniref:Putative ABC transport system permease protein n=1 Tax=Deinobacterium chartae TaxID=521158 RepID=A0A841HWR2_9DEIO|nr:ABC transporter permease [Deinobacterium chartae]MBB6097971.1 putative ABC transport system permease protein [Deinobacterium chartae]
MTFSDLFRLALRGLSRRAVRTTLTVLGIVVAVASMVIFLSLGEGIRQVFRQELGSIGPDVQVSVNGLTQGAAPLPDVPQEVAGRLEARAAEYGIRSVTPVVLSVRGGFDPSQSFVIFGYPAAQGTADVLPNARVAQGRALTAADEGQAVAVVGAKAAQNGNFRLGSEVRYNRNNAFRVVGILEEEGGLTDSFILVPLSTLQRANGFPGRLTYVGLKLFDAGEARNVAQRIEQDFDLTAQTQSDFLRVLDRAVTVSDAIRFGISLIALVVGGLAVANTVMMGVFERTREFGTMRAIGAQPGFVWRLVLLESLLLSLLGGLGGLLLGYLGIVAVNAYTEQLAAISAAALTGRLVLMALGVSLLLGLLAGLLPARSAGRIRITEALGRN